MSDGDDGVRVIGLTGGIGAGKSTVGAMLRERGVCVIDADRLAREVVAPPSPVLDALAERFGAGILRSDGQLDRAGLAAIVFADADALAALNAITHPAIAAAARDRVTDLGRRGWRWGVYEAALLVGHDLHPGLDLLVVVDAAERVRVRRVMARDRVAAPDVLSRMAAQPRPEVLREAADLCVRNDGDEAALLGAVADLHDALIARFGPARHGTSGAPR